jgi:hypothetical protein
VVFSLGGDGSRKSARSFAAAKDESTQSQEQLAADNLKWAVDALTHAVIGSATREAAMAAFAKSWRRE